MDNLATRLIEEWRRSRNQHFRQSSRPGTVRGGLIREPGHEVVQLPDGRLVSAIAGGSRQYFQDTLNEPPIANLTAVTATVETILWNVSNYTPIAAGDCRPGKIYKVTAGGIMSFAATGSLTITPRFGLTVAAGITMGPNATALLTPGVTTNAPWYLEFTVICRTVGAPGVTSTVIGTGFFITDAVLTSQSTVGGQFAIGGTSATVDVSIATGICIGWTLSVAGTVTPQYAFIQSLN